MSDGEGSTWGRKKSEEKSGKLKGKREGRVAETGR